MAIDDYADLMPQDEPPAEPSVASMATDDYADLMPQPEAITEAPWPVMAAPPTDDYADLMPQPIPGPSKEVFHRAVVPEAYDRRGKVATAMAKAAAPLPEGPQLGEAFGAASRASLAGLSTLAAIPAKAYRGAKELGARVATLGMAEPVKKAVLGAVAGPTAIEEYAAERRKESAADIGKSKLPAEFVFAINPLAGVLAKTLSKDGTLNLSAQTAQDLSFGLMEEAANMAMGMGIVGAGGKAAQAQRWTERIAQHLPEAAKFGGYIFTTTPGTVKERTEAGAKAGAYMLVPAVVAGLKTDIAAKVANFAILTGVDALSGRYSDITAEAKQAAQDNGTSFAAELASRMTIPVLFNSLFSAGVKSAMADKPGQEATRARLGAEVTKQLDAKIPQKKPWEEIVKELEAEEAAKTYLGQDTAKTPPLPGIGPGAASAQEFQPTAEHIISRRNADIDADRATRGLPPMAPVLKQEWTKVGEEAKARIENDAAWQDKLINELEQKPRATDAGENYGLLQRRMDLMNQRDKAGADLDDARTMGDPKRIEQATGDYQYWNEQIARLDVIDKATGAESGRSLAARKMVMNEEYDLVKMERDATIAKGAPLTPQEVTQIAVLQKKIATSEQRLEAKQAEPPAEEMVDRLIKDADKRQRQPTEAGLNRAQTIANRISNKVEKGQTDIGNLVRQLARQYVEEGINTRDALVDAVHSDLQQVLPDITRRQTMDAISGYGDFRPLSQDATSKTLRDLKGQLQQVAKLEDVTARKPLLKTGVERREPSDVERRLIQEVNEAKRRLGVVVTDPAKQLKSAEDARKTALRNQISDLEYQLANKTKIIKNKTPPQDTPEITALRAQRDALREQFNEMFPREPLSGAQKLAMMTKSAEANLKAWEERLANAQKGIFGKLQEKVSGLSDAKIEALRAQRDAIKAEVETLREMANPRATPEEIALKAKKASIMRSILATQERIANADFGKKTRAEVPLDAEGKFLLEASNQARMRFAEMKAKYEWQKKGLLGKAGSTVGQSVDLARSVMTSMDISAVGRQGALLGASHPLLAAKSFVPMLKAFRSEGNALATMAEIAARPNAPLYQRAKLAITNLEGGSRYAREEVAGSSWARKIWGLAGSQRSYTVFLNKLRADVFDRLYDVASNRGREAVSPETAEDIANYINVATGRGNMGKASGAVDALSKVFFSPRLVLSRFQYLLGQPAATAQTPVAKKLIMEEYVRTIAGFGLMYGLAQMSGAEMSFDPRSSDFGKIKIGDTRVDLLAGLAQVAVLLSRLLTGQKVTQAGRVAEIRGEEVEYGKDDAADVIANFFRGKLAPGWGTAVDVLSGKNIVGEPITKTKALVNLVTPLAYQDVFALFEAHGVPKGAALQLLSVLGLGVQHYAKKPSLLERKKAEVEKQKAMTEEERARQNEKRLEEARWRLETRKRAIQ